MTIKKKFFFFILRIILILKLHFFYAILIILYSKKIHGSKESKKKILVFRKSGGIHDIKSAIETGLIHKNIYEINRDIIKFTYRFFIDDLDGEQFDRLDKTYDKKSVKYYFFLKNSFFYLKRFWDLNTIIGFNIFFRPEFEVQKASKYLKIKYICCHKEGISSASYLKILYKIYKKINISFYGEKILFYNQTFKNIIKKLKIVDSNKLITVGCSRADKQFQFKKKRQINKNKKTIIFFIMPKLSILPSSKRIYINNNNITHENKKLLSWDNYNLKTTELLIKIAKKYGSKIEIIFKDKIGSNNKRIKNLIEKNKQNNIKYINFGNSDYLIQKADIVLCSYSTTTFEALASGAKLYENKIGLPKSSKLNKYTLDYQNQLSKIKNYQDLEKCINLSFKDTKIKKGYTLQLKKLLKDYLGNNDGKSSIKLAKEIR